MNTASSIVLKKVKGLEDLLRYGAEDNVVVQAVDVTVTKLLYHEKNKSIKDRYRFRRKLKMFEKKYHMKSDNFHERFEKGTVGDKMDYMEWDALYDMNKRVEERLAVLKQVNR